MNEGPAGFHSGARLCRQRNTTPRCTIKLGSRQGASGTAARLYDHRVGSTACMFASQARLPIAQLVECTVGHREISIAAFAEHRRGVKAVQHQRAETGRNAPRDADVGDMLVEFKPANVDVHEIATFIVTHPIRTALYLRRFRHTGPWRVCRKRSRTIGSAARPATAEVGSTTTHVLVGPSIPAEGHTRD